MPKISAKEYLQKSLRKGKQLGQCVLALRKYY